MRFIRAQSACRQLQALSFAILCLWLSFACKPKKSDLTAGESSATKDFAFSGTAKNFAVIAGNGGQTNKDVIYDASNWENMIKRQQLGKFNIIYLERKNATVADIKRAFMRIGGQIQADSTVLFAYSGPGNAGRLIAANNETFTYVDIAAALRAGAESVTKKSGVNAWKKVKAKRFYWIAESAIGTDDSAATFSNNHMAQLFATFNQEEKRHSWFDQAFVFASTTTDQVAADKLTASFYGRFSYEFVRNLDKYVRLVGRQRTAHPTIRDFFNSIVKTTNATAGRHAEYRLRPKALANETLFAANFVPPIEPKPVSLPPRRIAPQSNGVPGGPSTASTAGSPALNLSIEGLNGRTTLGNIFTGDKMLIEVSASWCGPCLELAQTLASRNSSCGVATLIVNDNSSTLRDWQAAAQDANYSGEIVNHSYGVGSSEELTSNWLRTLSGQPVTIDFFPTLFLLDRSGTVISSGQQDAMAKCGI